MFTLQVFGTCLAVRLIFTLRVKAAEATAATHAGIRNQPDAATGNSEQGLTVWVTSLQREPEALLRSLQEF